MQIGHNNRLAPCFSTILPNLPGITVVKESQFRQYKENKDAFFTSMTIPETPLQHSDGFQLVTNRKETNASDLGGRAQ